MFQNGWRAGWLAQSILMSSPGRKPLRVMMLGIPLSSSLYDVPYSLLTRSYSGYEYLESGPSLLPPASHTYIHTYIHIPIYIYNIYHISTVTSPF